MAAWDGLAGDLSFNQQSHAHPHSVVGAPDRPRRAGVQRLVARVGEHVARTIGCDKSEAYWLICTAADELHRQEQQRQRQQQMLASPAAAIRSQQSSTPTTTTIGTDAFDTTTTIDPHILHDDQLEAITAMAEFDGTVDHTTYSFAPPLVGYERATRDQLQKRLADVDRAINGGGRLAGASGPAGHFPSPLPRGTRRFRANGDGFDGVANYASSEPNLDPQLTSRAVQTQSSPYPPSDTRSVGPSGGHNMGPPPPSFESLSLLQQPSEYPLPKRTKTVASEPINEVETMSLPGGGRTRRPRPRPGPSEHGNETEASSQAGHDRTCDSCNRSFPFPRDLKAHIQAHHAGGFPCDKCSACLATPYSLQRHKASKHGEGQPCGHCPMTFGTHAALSMHLAKHHGIGELCPMCDCAVPKLSRHLADFHKQGHPCGNCSRYFATDHSARHHRKNCVAAQPQQQHEQHQPKQRPPHHSHQQTHRERAAAGGRQHHLPLEQSQIRLDHPGHDQFP